MPIELRKEEVRQMLQDGAQLVEVLSSRAYQKIHLAGAINLPLYELDEKSSSQLDEARPVIVYCADYQ
ncbi:MAG: rhodanese-like domain-containing protein [Anaerolineales bacterium]|jgi:rhodanese-related sulfurtransferase